MDVEIKKISDFITRFLEYMETHHGSIMDELDKSGQANSEMDEEIAEALENFKHIKHQEQ